MDPTTLAACGGQWADELKALCDDGRQAGIDAVEERRTLSTAQQDERQQLIEQQQQQLEAFEVEAAGQQAAVQRWNSWRLEQLAGIVDRRRRLIADRRDTALTKLAAQGDAPPDEGVAALTERFLAFERMHGELTRVVDSCEEPLQRLQSLLDADIAGAGGEPMPADALAEKRLAELQASCHRLPEELDALQRDYRRHWLDRWHTGLVYGAIIIGHLAAIMLLLQVYDWQPPLPLLLAPAITFIIACGVRVDMALRRTRGLRQRLEDCSRRLARTSFQLPLLDQLGRRQLDVRQRMADRAKQLLDREQAKEAAIERVRTTCQRFVFTCQGCTGYLGYHKA